MTDESVVPTYTKIGIRVTLIVMLILTVLLLKNCVTSVRYGLTTGEEAITQAYEQGVDDGRSLDRDKAATVKFDNPVLTKTYLKGFREGWDSSHRKAE